MTAPNAPATDSSDKEASAQRSSATATAASLEKRSRQRDRLQAVRAEATSLQRQLRDLLENHELRESLDRLMDRSSQGDKWKYRAMQERSRKRDASQRNVLLRQRLSRNTKLLDEVRALVNKQIARSMTANRQFERLSDDGAIVFSTLRARLDARSGMLDTLVPQWDAACLTTRAAPAPWAVYAMDRGVSVVINDAFAVPFHSTKVRDTISRLTLLFGLQVLADNQLDMIAQLCDSNRAQVHDRLSGASESDRRLILRRIEHARGTLLLWEGASSWQSSDADTRHQVCDSGWTLIEPADGHSDNVCVVRYGGCLQIHGVNEAQLRPNDRQVAGIVRAVRSHVKTRNLHMENDLIDSWLQQARRRN